MCLLIVEGMINYFYKAASPIYHTTDTLIGQKVLLQGLLTFDKGAPTIN